MLHHQNGKDIFMELKYSDTDVNDNVMRYTILTYHLDAMIKQWPLEVSFYEQYQTNKRFDIIYRSRNIIGWSIGRIISGY